jgi:hypothetical protein
MTERGVVKEVVELIVGFETEKRLIDESSEHVTNPSEETCDQSMP